MTTREIIINPRMKIADIQTHMHGLKLPHLINCIEENQARLQISAILNGKILVTIDPETDIQLLDIDPAILKEVRNINTQRNQQGKNESYRDTRFQILQEYHQALVPKLVKATEEAEAIAHDYRRMINDWKDDISPMKCNNLIHQEILNIKEKDVIMSPDERQYGMIEINDNEYEDELNVDLDKTMEVDDSAFKKPKNPPLRIPQKYKPLRYRNSKIATSNNNNCLQLPSPSTSRPRIPDDQFNSTYQYDKL